MNTGTRGQGGGGEFGVDVLGYGDNSDLLTFCLEVDEFLSFGKTYNYDIDVAARLGGNNFNSDDPGSSASPTYDTLSKGTDFLYDLFYRGLSDATIWSSELLGYGGSDRKADATALQFAIWVLEDEKKLGSSKKTSTGVGGNKYLNLVESEFGTIGEAKENYDWTTSNVRVMNIWKGNKLKQSQVTYVTPESGLVLLITSGAIGIMGFLRRRRKVAAA
ncbi:MAG: hypothetical protein AAGB46_07235 [Verrucomicrobiota bacterium]